MVFAAKYYQFVVDLKYVHTLTSLDFGNTSCIFLSTKQSPSEDHQLFKRNVCILEDGVGGGHYEQRLLDLIFT